MRPLATAFAAARLLVRPPARRALSSTAVRLESVPIGALHGGTGNGNGTGTLTAATAMATLATATAAAAPMSKTAVPSAAAAAATPSAFNVLDTPTSEAHRARYTLGRQIGSGNYAVVKEALDRKTGQRVAIKIMDKRRCGRAICRNEVDVLLALSRKVKHQRLTPVLDVFEDRDCLYIVLELLRGGELFERVAHKGRLPEPEVAHILRKLVYALEALHRHGILHRDIKLENIVMSDVEGGEGADDFKIADFGFAVDGGEASLAAPAAGAAAPLSPAKPDSERRASFAWRRRGGPATAKRDGVLAGTLGYAAPEVLREACYTPACDIWSAGVVTYILLAGYPPFPLLHPERLERAAQEQRVAAELEAIEFGRAPEQWKRAMLEEPWNTISPEAKHLVSKMLVLDPARRITTRGVLQHPFVRRHTEADTYEYQGFE